MAEPMSDAVREDNYRRQNRGRPLTPRQRRRLRGPLFRDHNGTVIGVAEKAIGRAPAPDPDGLLADIQRRAVDRLHGRETPECGHVGGPYLRCTRPAGHVPSDVHTVANGGQRWES